MKTSADRYAILRRKHPDNPPEQPGYLVDAVKLTGPGGVPAERAWPKPAPNEDVLTLDARESYLYELASEAPGVPTPLYAGPREVVEKSGMVFVPAGNGVLLVSMPHVPLMRKHALPPTLTPSSMASAIAAHTRWALSPHAPLEWAMKLVEHGDKLSMDTPFAEYPRIWASLEAELWADDDTFVVLGGEDFTDMVVAAALEHPRTPLHQDEMVAPNGIVMFRTPVTEPALGNTIGGVDVPVYGLTWQHGISSRGPAVTVNTLINANHEAAISDAAFKAARDAGEPVFRNLHTDSHPVFRVLNHAFFPYGLAVSEGDHGIMHANIGLLRSVQALLRSPQTVVGEPGNGADELPATKKQRRKAASAPKDRRIRVVSLKNSEHGRYQLEAVTGRRLRAHWVRGHWRNQWYASTQQHRVIWVDGFVRGDATLGTVTGRKIHTI